MTRLLTGFGVLALTVCSFSVATLVRANGPSVDPCCQSCGCLPTVCTCTSYRPIVETRYRCEKCVSYRDVCRTRYRRERFHYQVPCTTYINKCETVWVPKTVVRRVPVTTMRTQVGCRTVPYQTVHKVPQVHTRIVPEQHVRYVPFTRTFTRPGCTHCPAPAQPGCAAPAVGAIAAPPPVATARLGSWTTVPRTGATHARHTQIQPIPATARFAPAPSAAAVFRARN